MRSPAGCAPARFEDDPPPLDEDRRALGAADDDEDDPPPLDEDRRALGAADDDEDDPPPLDEDRRVPRVSPPVLGLAQTRRRLGDNGPSVPVSVAKYARSSGTDVSSR
ncbi:hypothetical protein [Mobilicoccus caccae]|uniref:hypothetical protein n=1 Tax=Mobilicoccus caccae TaxID=1859295 RepID=UPI0024E0BADE|nr:hypothetical protein [Mobilicoccus caccae]